MDIMTIDSMMSSHRRYRYGMVNGAPAHFSDVTLEDLPKRFDFTGVTFSRVTFESNLVGSNFEDTIMEDVDFRGCSLAHARFVRAKLYKVKADDCFIEHSNFTDAIIIDSSFSCISGSEARFNSTKIERSDFHEAEFCEGSLRNIRVVDSDFRNVGLLAVAVDGADFKNCLSTQDLPSIGVIIEAPIMKMKESNRSAFRL